MKKNIYLIVMIFLYFASPNANFAEEGYIEKVLDLNHAVVEFNLQNISELGEIKFQDSTTASMFSNFKTANNLLKQEFIRLYKIGKIDYNSIHGIVTNYNYFIYHTKQMFIAKKFKESYPNSKEADLAISTNYGLARSYYLRVKNLVDRSLYH